MKIILIRQTEDGSVPIHTRKSDAAAYRVYTGSGRAGLETAEALFVLSDPPVVTPLQQRRRLRKNGHSAHYGQGGPDAYAHRENHDGLQQQGYE